MWTLPFVKNKPLQDEVDRSNGNHSLIQLRNVSKNYKTAAGDFPALKGVDLDMKAGEFVSVIGKSGSGKSTLLNMITGIDRPSAGEVVVNNTALQKLSENQMALWRGRNLGIVFQFFQLLPTISVIENIMLPMDFCNTYPMRQREKRALELLELVDLTQHAYKLPTALSGGQQQRVAIARALANDPPIVIADEPTGNLDSRTADSIFQLFNDLVAQGKTIIIVTHDSGLAKRAERTALIADGEIVNEYVLKAMPALSHPQLLEVTRKANKQQFEPGTMILQEGTSGDAFFIVSNGVVEIVLARPNHSDVVAAQLGPGQYFGEMQLLHGLKRSASARAYERGPVEVLSLSFETMRQLLSTSEATREAMRALADQRKQQNIELRGGKL
ncbi:MAG TPA: ATP-binding cassette domain-containing protein [Anaerolineales bacterium]|nr:ATP-binding cassette domain-containing protein [Anaerolineales bacterium]